MDSKCLQVQGIGKRYSNGVWGMRNISFTLRQETFVALVGANGAGKTTLIHTLAGVTIPTEGKITIDGTIVDSIGWCSQHPVIDWFMSVQDNVLLGARLAGQNWRESKRSMLEALTLVGLEQYVKRQPDQLSGGQQQRLQIARALVSHAPLLLLDEPTTGLDPLASEQLMNYVKVLTRNGCLAIVSSHDLPLVEKQADIIMFLKEGLLLACESRSQFFERFSDGEIIEVDYEGTLAEDLLQQLRAWSTYLLATNPLQMAVKQGMQLEELAALLDGSVRVIDIRRRPPQLRDAYFVLTESSPSKTLS